MDDPHLLASHFSWRRRTDLMRFAGQIGTDCPLSMRNQYFELYKELRVCRGLLSKH